MPRIGAKTLNKRPLVDVPTEFRVLVEGAILERGINVLNLSKSLSLTNTYLKLYLCYPEYFRVWQLGVLSECLGIPVLRLVELSGKTCTDVSKLSHWAAGRASTFTGSNLANVKKANQRKSRAKAKKILADVLKGLEDMGFMPT